MRTLYLSGHGIGMRVENARLMIRDGCEYDRPEPMQHGLRPKYDEYDNIVIFGHSENITMESLKWPSKQNIQLTILNWDGSLLTNVLIPKPKLGTTRFAQYQSFTSDARVDIGYLIDYKKIKGQSMFSTKMVTYSLLNHTNI